MLPWGTIIVASVLSVLVPKLMIVPWIQQQKARRQQKYHDKKQRLNNNETTTNVTTQSTRPCSQGTTEDDVIWSTLFPHAEASSNITVIQYEHLTKEQQIYMYCHSSTVVTNHTELYLRDLLENEQYGYSKLGLTLQDVQHFHPVVMFPTITYNDNQKRPYYIVKNLTLFNEHNNNDDESSSVLEGAHTTDPLLSFGVGKYNERRINLYDTDLFSSTTKEQQRDVHIGIDLYGPIGTPVYAFEQGTVLYAGYNDAPGDYGNVVVVEHELYTTSAGNETTTIWALYGHLSNPTLEHIHYRQKKENTSRLEVKKGNVIGWMGSSEENGGWSSIHVHFQLSTIKPKTHDMPGVVSSQDRSKALHDYPDPRLVLGWLYYDD